MLTFSNFNCQTISVVMVASHKRRHKRVRIMCFQISRPISNQTITSGVRLIETIVGELFQLSPERFRNFLSCATNFNRTLDEFRLDLFHQVNFLLTNSLTQRVSLTTSKSTPFLRNLHKLLLIDQNSVGIFQRVFHSRMQISYFFLAVFAPNKAVNKLHRARTIKSHHSNNIFKRSRLQSAQISLHSRRFQLEHTSRVAALKQLIGLFIIKRQLRKVNFFLVSFSDNPHGVINNRKVRKSQKVHLQ